MEPEALGRELFQALYCSDSGCFYILSWFYIFPPSFQPSTNTVFQWPTSYHIIPIWTFANSSWAQNQGSGWLDDLQIQGWDSDLGTTIFLKSWSKGNFSDEEMTELQDPFRVYFIGFTRVVQDHVSEFQVECEYSPLIWRDSQWVFSPLVRLLFPLIMVYSFPLYSTACTQLSQVVSNPDSLPPPRIPDSSRFLHFCVTDDVPAL